MESYWTPTVVTKTPQSSKQTQSIPQTESNCAVQTHPIGICTSSIILTYPTTAQKANTKHRLVQYFCITVDDAYNEKLRIRG